MRKKVSALLFREVHYDKPSGQVALNFYPLPGEPWLIDLCKGTGFDPSVNWRKGRDSNPRRSCPLGSFRDCYLQPLGHPSKIFSG